MGRTASRPLLHVITDETVQTRFDHVELARLALRGGADVVQLREKRPRTTAWLVERARAIAGEVHELGGRLIVNDRVDVAIAAGADGVHLGPHDLDPAVARRLLGREAWIGLTANDPRRARQADDRPVDYLGVGPVFATTSKKPPAEPLGIEGVRRIVDSVSRPVVAIGGIDPDGLGPVLETGVAGVAVLSSVAADADPRRAVERLRETIDRWHAARGERDESRAEFRA
jgi:thiamine-phosphate pyrophosphorylase